MTVGIFALDGERCPSQSDSAACHWNDLRVQRAARFCGIDEQHVSTRAASASSGSVSFAENGYRL